MPDGMVAGQNFGSGVWIRRFLPQFIILSVTLPEKHHQLADDSVRYTRKDKHITLSKKPWRHHHLVYPLLISHKWLSSPCAQSTGSPSPKPSAPPHPTLLIPVTLRAFLHANPPLSPETHPLDAVASPPRLPRAKSTTSTRKSSRSASAPTASRPSRPKPS